jgi:hypothetical protein
VTYLDELVRRVRVGVSPDERRGEVRASAVVAAAVRVEAPEGQVLLYPRRVGECVGLEERDHVVFDRDVLAAAHRQVLECVDLRRKHVPDQRDARDGRVAEVQARQAGPVGRDNLLQQGVKRVGLGRPLAVLGRLIARRADSDGGLGQAEGERLPGQRIPAQEVAQVAGRVVEVEQRARGYLGEQRLQHGRIRCDDALEQAERRIVARGLLALARAGARNGSGSDVAGGVCVPEKVRLALLLCAHASRGRRRQQLEALGQLRPYEAVLSDEAARKHTKETCRRRVGASAAPAGVSEAWYGREKREWSRVWECC